MIEVLLGILFWLVAGFILGVLTVAMSMYYNDETKMDDDGKIALLVFTIVGPFSAMFFLMALAVTLYTIFNLKPITEKIVRLPELLIGGLVRRKLKK